MTAKNRPTKSRQSAARSPYIWYLQRSFLDEFDRSPWWESLTESEISPEAALYELARRHPRIGELRRKFHAKPWYGQELRPPLTGAAKKKKLASQAFDDLGQEPEAVHCLCLIGLKPWPELDSRNQDYWVSSAGKLKGVDCRDDIERCQSITQAAYADVMLNRAMAQKGKKKGRDAGSGSHEEWMDSLAKDLKENPFDSTEIDKAISMEALSAHRQGHLLISIAPDLTAEEAKILLDREYREHRKLLRDEKQRPSFYLNWLEVISNFEEAEDRHGGAKAQLFARYRRAMDGIDFGLREKSFAGIGKRVGKSSDL
jgi:hypothetical protein